MRTAGQVFVADQVAALLRDNPSGMLAVDIHAMLDWCGLRPIGAYAEVMDALRWLAALGQVRLAPYSGAHLFIWVALPIRIPGENVPGHW